MISIKKLDGGGDKDVELMIEEASVMGVDLIELMWTRNEDRPRYSVAEVQGFQVPLSMGGEVSGDVTEWVDGQVNFYPDKSGRCWGYVFDNEFNRDQLANSFVNAWYRVVDKKLRDELLKLAEEKGYPTEKAKLREISIKKTKRELDAEKHAETLEKKLAEQERKMEELRKELEEAMGEKAKHLEKRLKGVKIKERDKFLNNDEETE